MPKEKNSTDPSPSSSPKLLKCQREVVKHKDRGGARTYILPFFYSHHPQATHSSKPSGSLPTPQSLPDQSDYGPWRPAPRDPTPEPCRKLRQLRLSRLGRPQSQVARTPGSLCPGRICAAGTGPSTRLPRAAGRPRATPLPLPAHMASTERGPGREGPRTAGGGRGAGAGGGGGGEEAQSAPMGRGGVRPDRPRGLARREAEGVRRRRRRRRLPESRSTSPGCPV